MPASAFIVDVKNEMSKKKKNHLTKKRNHLLLYPVYCALLYSIAIIALTGC